jgi:heme/copper-type cytochrome/quinol oxidase subunit 2
VSVRNNVIAIVAVSFIAVGSLWAFGNLTKDAEEADLSNIEGILLTAQRSTFNGTNPDIHVKVNQPIRLVVSNEDIIQHDLQIQDKTGSIASINTAIIPAGRNSPSTAIIAYKPGSYEYFCSLHPEMRGKVIAEP